MSKASAEYGVKWKAAKNGSVSGDSGTYDFAIRTGNGVVVQGDMPDSAKKAVAQSWHERQLKAVEQSYMAGGWVNRGGVWCLS